MKPIQCTAYCEATHVQELGTVLKFTVTTDLNMKPKLVASLELLVIGHHIIHKKSIHIGKCILGNL